MFRGIETILQGRDPREAWAVHPADLRCLHHGARDRSVRAVENALGISIPDNARLIRNLIEAAQYVQDHVIHFYPPARPGLGGCGQRPVRRPGCNQRPGPLDLPWPNSSPGIFLGVRDRLQVLWPAGSLACLPMATGGTRPIILPAEGNLLAWPTTWKPWTGSASSSRCTPSWAGRTHIHRPTWWAGWPSR